MIKAILAAALLTTLAPAVPPTTAAPLPAAVVVEEFQSQGCSSCPPANANINALAARPDLIVLSFAVTYWDQLGWRDTFARDPFTRRQWDYAHGLRHANVFTPQVVVGGAQDQTGIDGRSLGQAIAGARPPPSRIRVGAGRIDILPSPPPPREADVWLVRYDPRVQQVAIARGENAGRTLPHRNIVRQLIRLGGWRGPAQTYAVPGSPDPAWRTVILVQVPGGPILTDARL
jgi:hypothetical protein